MPKAKLPNKDFRWTSKLAYIVGLIVTDGCLSSDQRHIVMRSSDLQLLKTFKKCLSLSNAIGETFDNGLATKPAYRIQFGNVQLYRWFLKIGLFPRKTYTIGKLEIPDKYFRDFLRGHLDGDGSVWTYKDYYNTFKNQKYVYNRLWIRFISASGIHIKWLAGTIQKLLPVKGHIFERKPQKRLKSKMNQTTSIWEVKFAKKESLKLLQWIYYKSNLPCLKILPKEKRREYTRIK